MQAVALGLLKKLAPYFCLVGCGLAVGLYLGYHIGSDGLAAARLALSAQQDADTKAVAAANAAAAVDLQKANASANTAEAELAEAEKQASSKDTNLTNQIALQAAKSGQDAPDAPVLKTTLDTLESGQ